MTTFPFDEPCTMILGASGPRSSQRTSLISYWLGESRPLPVFVWVVPRQGEPPTRLRISQFDVATVGGRRLRRVTLDGAETRIYQVLAEMLDGGTLGTVVAEPSLAQHELRPRDEYVALPWLLRATAQTAASRARFAQGATSAHEQAPSVVRALVPSSLEFVLSPQSDALAFLPELAAALARDTGLEFDGAAAIRLGAVEAHFLPGADADGPSRLHVRASGDGLRIRYVGPPGTSRVAIRARQMMRGYVIADVLGIQAFPSDESLVDLDVPGPEGGPFTTTVTVWTAPRTLGNDSPMLVAHEHTFHWIRSIELGMHLMEGTVDLRAPWLERLGQSKARRRQELARSLSVVRRSGPAEVSTIGHPPAHWEAVIESRESLGARLEVAEPRGGYFAPSNNDEGEGRAEIIVWLRKLVARGASEIWIVDPHFDAFGLESLARLETRIPVRVLHRARPETEESFRALFAQLHPILPHVRVARASRDFHDRYWFTTGRAGELLEGFLVSNSWQSAAQRQPLVVAPLEALTLQRVWDYVSDLAIDAEALVVPDTAPDVKSSSEGSEGGYETDPVAIASRLPAVLGTPAFPPTWAQLADALANTHDTEFILAGLGDAPALMDALADLVGSWPERGAVAHDQRDEREFLSLDELLRQGFDRVARDAANIFERGHAPYRPWAIRFAVRHLARAGADRLVSVLDRLVSAPKKAGLAARLPRSVAIAHVIGALRERRLADEGAATAAALVRAEQPGVRALAIGLLLPVLDVRGQAQRSVSAGLPEGAREVDVALRLLDALGPSEHCVALASVVFELRVRANRAGVHNQPSRVDPTAVRARRAVVVTQMIRVWPPGDVELLPRVAALVGGPSPGSWARSTHEELFAPLLERGAIGRDALARLYSSQLLESLRSVAEGRGQFFHDRDIELTEVAVSFLAVLRDEVSGSVAAELRSLARAASRGRERPFARSRFHSEWANAGVVHLWAGAIGALVVGLSNAAPEWSAEAERWIACARVVLEDANAVEHDPTGLASWCRRLLPPR